MIGEIIEPVAARAETTEVTHVSVLRASELTATRRAAWARLQESLPEFGSPYFRPEFTDHVAAVRDDVEVAFLESHGDLVGVFPFQRGAGDVGRPVGGRLNDFHGVVVGPGVEWNVPDLMRECGLRSWFFDHLADPGERFAAHRWSTGASPFVDLTDGFEAYERSRREAQAHDFKQTFRKLRKLEHDEGPVRFELYAPHELLDTLLAWKSAQYRQTGLTDVFSFEWTASLVRRVLAAEGEGFRGVLSALYVRDEPAAIHLGMQSRGVLHSWFPAYDDRFDKYSPGLVLLIELARVGAENGIRRIDLGLGDERYKRQFSNAATTLSQGVVESNGLGRFLRHTWRRTKDWVKTSPIAGAARLPARLLRTITERQSFS